MLRTADVEVDREFEVKCEVTKTEVRADGVRVIRGVASGVEEDQDGERVSKRAIRNMAKQVTANGAVKLTSSHSQDWMTEIGDVTHLQHDAATDELIIESQLPAAGEDPLADKAWKQVLSGQPMGFSIGGKLRKAFFELVDDPNGVGKGGRPRRRKVLDDIHLKHVMLTKKPSYRGTFAEAVAKSFDESAPESDDAYFEAEEPVDVEVEKAAPPAAPAAPAPGGKQDNVDDPAPDGQTPTAEGGNTDAEDAKDLPMARHLACPNCGHEFAAELPANRGDMPNTDPSEDKQDDGTARKSRDETIMDATARETIEKIRALTDQLPQVEKTDPAPAADDVAKTEPAADTTDVDVAKSLDELGSMLAASHRHNGDRIDTIEKTVNEAVGKLVEAITGLAERGTGRQSVARVLPPAGEVEKTDADDDVDAVIAKTDDPIEALKLSNAASHGIGR